MTKRNKIEVARTDDRVFFIMDDEPKTSGCYAAELTDCQYEQREDAHIDALRGLLRRAQLI